MEPSERIPLIRRRSNTRAAPMRGPLLMLFQTRLCLRLLFAIGSGSLALLTIFIAPSSAVSQESRRAKVSSQTLFDDFNYSNYRQLAKHGWIIRTAAGWPGVPGAIWGNQGVSFPADLDHRGNRLLRMISFTDGTGLRFAINANTSRAHMLLAFALSMCLQTAPAETNSSKASTPSAL